MHSASVTYPIPLSVPNTSDHDEASTHRNTICRPAERNAVPIRVRDRRRRLVDRPDLRCIRGVAVRDVERLTRRAGHDPVRAYAPVAVDDLAGLAGASRHEERGDVVKGAVAWKGGDETSTVRTEVGREDEGGVCRCKKNERRWR